MTPPLHAPSLDPPTHLDLFTGIGGFSLAAEAAGFRTIAHAEPDPDASLVLAHHWPHVPNLRDVRTIGLHSALGPVDLLTGGVPCQPASLLGKRLGSADDRWLWPDTLRIVRELRPRFAVFENPPALLSLESGCAFAGILGGLAACGYDVLWGILPAAAVGAGHLRERLCLIAADTHRSGWAEGRQGRSAGHRPQQTEQTLQMGSPDTQSLPQRPRLRPAGQKNQIPRLRQRRSGDDDLPLAPHSDDQGLERHARHVRQPQRRHPEARPTAPRDLRGRVSSPDWWHEDHTGIPVLAHGIPTKLAEAASRCTGNAIVPQAFLPILRALHAEI